MLALRPPALDLYAVISPNKIADGLVMTSGLNPADAAASSGRNDEVFVTELKNITSDSFENELTEFVLDPPLPLSSARTITAAHCLFYERSALHQRAAQSLPRNFNTHRAQSNDTGKNK